jgi:DNA-binding transcriptional LysR family regulator
MKLPPLNALRAFEAAARHGGFAGAAEELHVTRGAVSRHVKLLEDHLGVLLFVREAQGVRLTPAAARLQPVLSEAFRAIAGQAQRIVADAADLRIICPPATSIRWLLPNLDSFRERHPGIRVRLTTDFHGDLGFDTAEYDIGFSVEKWPRKAGAFFTQTLFPVLLTPACAPRLTNGRDKPLSPSYLADCVLLHETPARADWGTWLDAFGIEGIEPSAEHDFPNLDMATRAAVMGTGFVMSDLVLCRAELEAGLLVTPFPDMICPAPLGGICVMCARERRRDHRIDAFVSWAVELGQAEAARLPWCPGPA